MRFNYQSALHKLANSHAKGRELLNQHLVPEWAKSVDFIDNFVPYLTIVGDSREQKDWIKTACETYGINFELAKKDKSGNENLKEGDYTFKINIGDKCFDFRGMVAYERKGSLSELFNNCKGKDRERIENEFKRFREKKYKKVVLLLEVGNRLLDLAGAEFNIPIGRGQYIKKNVGNVIFTSIMSWQQPNNINFNVIQSENHLELFWLMLLDMFYYFRGEVKREVRNYVSGSEKPI